MSLSSSVKHKEIEAVYYQQNQRVEFRLMPNKLYSTDLIVCNLGLSKAANQTRLHKWAGIYGEVENITLFDGNTVLSNLSDLAFWAGFKQFTNRNQYNENVGAYYNGGLQSNIWNQSDTNTNNLNTTGKTNQENFGAKLQEGTIRALQTLSSESGTYKGQLKLRQAFDLLNQMSYVDTSVFKNFRIVLELNTAAARSLRSRLDDADMTTTRPFLSVHEVTDEEILEAMMGKMSSVVFNEVEDDLVTIPAVTGMTNASRYVEQENNFHITAFNNKTLGRMLLWKQPTLSTNLRDPAANGSVSGVGIYSSTGFLNELEQVKINGRNVFARNGIQGGNRKLAKFVDTWGDCSMHAFNNGLAYIAIDNNTRQRYLADGNGDIGILDFVGVDMAKEKCQDLQIDLNRRGLFLATVNAGAGAGAADGDANNTFANDAERTAGSKYNASHSLGIWCEVVKAIVMKDGMYNVVYV